ncbi:MAG TPA: AAA family ATPase [Candidatus Saccharimonadaceae bacterium]|nr:AAA family ATPase [Candidatus Saccharimonadaceae bacterium]
MASVNFDYHSRRASEARTSRLLSKSTAHLLAVAGWVFLVAGLVILTVGDDAFAWVIIGLAGWLYMVATWAKRELWPLPIGGGSNVDDVLSRDILANLPKAPTPHDIATAVGRAQSGMFFAARFGLSAQFLQNIAEGAGSDSDALWQEALKVREAAAIPSLTGGMLILALLRQFPSHDTLLAQLHLDDDDIMHGIIWRQHLLDLIRDHTKRHRTGGVARDWSFGYIPLLQRFGHNVSEQIARGAMVNVAVGAYSETVDQMVSTFSRGGTQNVTLVGGQGSGKSTLVWALAARLLDGGSALPVNLKFRQVFILDSAALIGAAPGRGELENLVTQVLNEAFAAKNIIICLDNAQMFFEDAVGSVDLSNILLPILEAGRLRMILTMDEQRLLQISTRNPALAAALNRLNVPHASQDETLLVMQDKLIETEFRHEVTYTYQAVREAYRLSERYVHDIAQPGRALKLMESAAGYSEHGLVTINSVQQAIEKTLGVKVGIASDGDEREKLLHLEDLIHERMVDQARAVSVVSDALRRARAGVRNENRPIGTFLFLGPTGVGKTELSKALAAVYFGGEDRLVRVDMNEFVRPDDVARLIADGAHDPQSLVAQISKQPFSVVLLDEIEKAAPAVLTTLLQVLDEGILRDINGREISFRDAIIIATSNAGADRIREYIQRGYQLEQFEQKFIDELISSGQFRPEFINRFDEIAVFRPFSKKELLQVADLIIAGVNKTLEPQKVNVVVDDDARKLLVERGYDPRLGARPMRRVVQKAVENTVAKKMIAGELTTGGTITITREQVETSLGGVMPDGDIQPTPASVGK